MSKKLYIYDFTMINMYHRALREGRPSPYTHEQLIEQQKLLKARNIRKGYKNTVPRDKADVTLYKSIWKIVDGAIRDVYETHPEFKIARAHRGQFARSVTKRATGKITSFIEQSKKGPTTA